MLSRLRRFHLPKADETFGGRPLMTVGVGPGSLLISVAMVMVAGCSAVVTGQSTHDAGSALRDRSVLDDVMLNDGPAADDTPDASRLDGAVHDTVVPTPAAPRLTSRLYHTCFRRDRSTGWCWGSNFYGELGVVPPPGPPVDTRASPVRDSGEMGASIIAGPVSTVMVGATGTLSLRGSHPALHTGEGPFVRSARPEWVSLSGWTAPILPILASGLLCALTEGRVGCVGLDSTTLVFDAAEAFLSGVTLIDGLDRVAQFDVSSTHLCAIGSDGTLRCVGRNDHGQCGEPPTSRRPVGLVGRLPGMTQVAVGGSATCAVSVDAEAWCWGRNFDGTLGDGTTQDRWEPTRLPGLQRVTSIDVSETGSACAVSDGRVYCWGSPIRSYVVSGSRTGSRPTLVAGLEGVEAVALGAAHACAVTRSDAVYCWGDRAYGQLGDGAIRWMQPTQVPSLVALPH